MTKAKRRGHGEGSIYQRKDGRWVAVLVLEDGGRKSFYARTQKEAIEKLKQAQYEQKQGILATGPKQTLKTYLTQWFEEVHKPTLRLSSIVRYQIVLDKHILPALGQIPLHKLTAQKIQSFYTSKLKESYSSSSIHQISWVSA